jgi:LPS-assembly lipoprotein
MLSFKPRIAFASLAASLLLSGCLQPMYGGIEGGALRSELSAIAIEPIPDRIGHYLANELIFSLNGTGSQVTPKYRLYIAIRETVQTPLIDTISGRATAGSVVVDADYRLVPAAGGAPVTEGVAFTVASYDRSSQRFANIRAARDAEIRDAKTLADQIKTRLAIALARN